MVLNLRARGTCRHLSGCRKHSSYNDDPYNAETSYKYQTTAYKYETTAHNNETTACNNETTAHNN